MSKFKKYVNIKLTNNLLYVSRIHQQYTSVKYWFTNRFIMENIGQRFKNVRKVLNMSQEEFAESLGVTKQAISNVEHSKSLPSTAVMNKMLLNFDVNLNYLVSEVGNMFVNQDKIYKSLRAQLMSEMETLLDARGIK